MRELELVESILEENIKRTKALGSAFTLNKENALIRRELLDDRKFIIDEIRQIKEFTSVLFGANYMHIKIKRGVDLLNDLAQLEKDWIALDVYGVRNIINYQNKHITYDKN